MIFKSCHAGATRKWSAPFVILAFLLTILVASCSKAEEPMRLPVDETKLTITDGETAITQFDIEVAATVEQRSAGLMHRTDLPKDRGMLFVFDNEAQRFFWMQNTPTSLDIIYANRVGKIVYIAKDTKPFSTDAIPSRFPAKFAFEIHAGLSEELGVEVGQSLIHPLIEKK